MTSAFDRLAEAAGWIRLAVAPTLAGGVAGLLAGLAIGGAGGRVAGGALVAAGVAAGIFLAEHQRRTTGTSNFLARLSAHPELVSHLTPMTLADLNALPPAARADALTTCCGSPAWVDTMSQLFPFASREALLAAADHVWAGLTETDWREAFAHHPKIGDVSALREKFASTAAWAAGEQGAVQQASEATLQGLKQGNDEYELKFGYIFIVCATGKSAAEMLALLHARLPHSPYEEIHVAMAEQGQITRLRLEKLLTP